jgi:hypothetical protein
VLGNKRERMDWSGSLNNKNENGKIN